MDLNNVLAPLLAGGNPWLVLAGALAVLAFRRAGSRLPPAPGPAPTPGAVPTGRPLLDVVLRMLARGGAATGKAVPLADVPTADLLRARAELDAHLGERARQADAIRAALAPEPARPV